MLYNHLKSYPFYPEETADVDLCVCPSAYVLCLSVFFRRWRWRWGEGRGSGWGWRQLLFSWGRGDRQIPGRSRERASEDGHAMANDVSCFGFKMGCCDSGSHSHHSITPAGRTLRTTVDHRQLSHATWRSRPEGRPTHSCNADSLFPLPGLDPHLSIDHATRIQVLSTANIITVRLLCAYLNNVLKNIEKIPVSGKIFYHASCLEMIASSILYVLSALSTNALLGNCF